MDQKNDEVLKRFEKADWQTIVINLIYGIALIVVLLPLLINARYNFPSADDWAFGARGYRVIKENGNIIDVLNASLSTVNEFYHIWEGRFAAVFLESLQPGIFGEQYYFIVPYLMLGMLVFSQIFLCHTLLNLRTEQNRWMSIPIIMPVIIIDILYTPSTVESFYWYNGSVMYTFTQGLSFILFAIFFRLACRQDGSAKRVLRTIIAFIVCVLVGGGNFATSLYSLCGFLVLTVIYFVWDRQSFKKIWFFPFVIAVCLVVCIIAPGNAHRIESNFGGETGNVITAVWMSLYRTFFNIISWSNFKILLMVLLTVPFIWRAIRNMDFRFRLPGLFTLATFGIYASELTATVYVDGTAGGGRQAAIMYYSYNVWVLLNVAYWMGYLQRRFSRVGTKREEIIWKKGRLIFCAMVGLILVCVIYKTDLKNISSYMAYRDYKQGWAAQYAVEWKERFLILHDDNVKEVVFRPLSVEPYTFEYADLQDENGYIWVNSACASYYGKDSVIVVSENKE